MHKRLYKLLAVLLLPVFLVACEHGTESTVDKELLAATLQKAMDNAKEVDSLNIKAFGMAKVGAGMATVDSAKAGQVLNEAMMLVNEARSPRYASVLAELKTTTADWPAAEKDQIADAIDRLEKGTTRVWVARAVAEAVMINDRNSALRLLVSAAENASMIPDPKYRDLDLRSVAVLISDMDLGYARVVADRIGDPRVKAWALTEIGAGASKSSPSEAAIILVAAADTARGIPDRVTPESALLVADATAETRDAVLGAEAAKITASSARALAGVAAALSALEPVQARSLSAEAAKTAAGIDGKYPYTRAYAMSDVAIKTASFDVNAAKEMAEAIDTKHADAKAAAMIAVIRAESGNAAPTAVISDISAAVTVAESIEDEYDRAKALAALAGAAIPYNADKAVEIAGSIEETLGHETFAYSAVKDDVLADVAVELTGQDDDAAKMILDPTADVVDKSHGSYIVEPRFSKAMVLRTKARAYLAMADKKAATDGEAASKLYGKAANNAADAKSTKLQWEVAKRLCRTDSEKLFEYAATIPAGDYANQADALADIASNWSADGNPSAGLVWDMAAKAANTLGDDMESSDALNAVAGRCAAHDKAKATEIYAMSMRRLVKIGAAE